MDEKVQYQGESISVYNEKSRIVRSLFEVRIGLEDIEIIWYNKWREKLKH